MTFRPLLLAACLCVPFATLSAEWVSLFNGRDLTGWRQLGGTAPYAVVDGAIVGTPIPGTPNSFLVTEQEYGNFVFECEVRVEGAINSGLQFRSLSTPDYREGRVHGYQFEIDDLTARGWTGGIYDEARRGWLYPLELNPPAKTAYRPGHWNHLRIECVGPSLRTWVNGIPAAHLIDAETARGFIGLQVHSIGNRDPAGLRIHWRHLRIRTDVERPTPPEGFFIRNTRPNRLDPAEETLGWRLLWDGSTTAGWRAAGGETFPSEGWEIKDGTLTVNGRARVDLATRESFAAFDFQVEFLLTEGANSGIKYFATEADGVIGFEYQLLDDQRHPDAGKGVAGNRTLASLYDLIPSRTKVATREVPRGSGVWHHARIVVHPDRTVEHWLNGFKVVAYELESPLLEALIARSKYAGIDGFGRLLQSPIFLQDHGDIVHFRSIKLREIP